MLLCLQPGGYQYPISAFPVHATSFPPPKATKSEMFHPQQIRILLLVVIHFILPVSDIRSCLGVKIKDRSTQT